MKRYIKLYATLLKINFFTFTAYRANFINSTISSFVWSSFVIISMTLLTSRVSTIFGWTRNELLILAGVYNVISSIFYFLFSASFEEFSYTMHYGRLDTILLKPINSQFMISCWFIAYNNILRFIIGTVFIYFICSFSHIVINVIVLLQLFIIVIFSIIIFYAFWFLIMTLTIWYSKLFNLVEFLYTVNGFMRYPSQMYKKLPLVFFIFIFPLTLVATVPTRVIIHKVTVIEEIIIIAIAMFLLTISHFFWKFALRSYTSVS